MANHKSSEKRNRQTRVRTAANKYYAKTMRNALRRLRATSNMEEALNMVPKLNSMLDRLTKNNVIHSNKAANLKSSIARHVSSLQ